MNQSPEETVAVRALVEGQCLAMMGASGSGEWTPAAAAGAVVASYGHHQLPGATAASTGRQHGGALGPAGLSSCHEQEARQRWERILVLNSEPKPPFCAQQ